MVSLVFSLNFEVRIVQASPDTTSIYVDGYNTVTEDWTKVGASPYLSVQDQPANYGYSSTNLGEWSEFTFADLAGVPEINSVTFYLYCDPNGEMINVYIWDSGAVGWVNVGSFSAVSGWAWRSIDVSSTLTTDEEIDNAKVYFTSQKVGPKFENPVQVDCAYLYVDYTSAGEEYSRSASQSVSTSLLSTRILEALRSVSQETTLSFVANKIIDALKGVIQSISLALTGSGLSEFLKSASQSISMVLSGARTPDYSRFLTQTISTAFSSSRLADVTKTVSQTVYVALEVSGVARFFRVASQVVNVAIQGSRIAEFSRIATQSITVSTQAIGEFTAGITEYFRSASQTITISTQAIGHTIGTFFRDVTLAMNTAFQSSQLREIIREVTQAIGASTVSNRIFEVTRAVTQTINLALEGIGNLIHTYTRIASLTLNWRSEVTGLTGQIGQLIIRGKGMAFIAYSLVLALLGIVLSKKRASSKKNTKIY